MKTFGGEGRPGARRVWVAGSLVSDRALMAVVPAAEETVPAGDCSGFPRWAERLCLRPVAGAWRYAASARRLAAGLPPQAGPARSETARTARTAARRARPCRAWAGRCRRAAVADGNGTHEPTATPWLHAGRCNTKARNGGSAAAGSLALWGRLSGQVPKRSIATSPW